MHSRAPGRSSWHRARPVGLRRSRVDAFRVFAMLVIIVGHSEMLIGVSRVDRIQVWQLALNIVGRAAVPLFLLLAGEHLGPRLARDRAPGAARSYVRHLAVLYAAACALLLDHRSRQAGAEPRARHRPCRVHRAPGGRSDRPADARAPAAPLVPRRADGRGRGGRRRAAAHACPVVRARHRRALRDRAGDRAVRAGAGSGQPQLVGTAVPAGAPVLRHRAGLRPRSRRPLAALDGVRADRGRPGRARARGAGDRRDVRRRRPSTWRC